MTDPKTAAPAAPLCDFAANRTHRRERPCPSCGMDHTAAWSEEDRRAAALFAPTSAPPAPLHPKPGDRLTVLAAAVQEWGMPTRWLGKPVTFVRHDVEEGRPVFVVRGEHPTLVETTLEQVASPDAFALAPPETYEACERCGCTDVQESAWRMVNTGEVLDGEGPLDGCYCPRCEGGPRLDYVHTVTVSKPDPYVVPEPVERHPARVVFEAREWCEEAGIPRAAATWRAFLWTAGGVFNIEDRETPRGFVEVQRDDTLGAFPSDADYAVNVAAPACAYWWCRETGALYPIGARPCGDDFDHDLDEAEDRWFHKQGVIVAGLPRPGAPVPSATFAAVVHVDVAVERGLIGEETAHELLCGTPPPVPRDIADTYASIVYGIVTDEQIAALRDEAGAAGDTAMVQICHRALSGNAKARTECARVIADTAARAAED